MQLPLLAIENVSKRIYFERASGYCHLPPPPSTHPTPTTHSTTPTTHPPPLLSMDCVALNPTNPEARDRLHHKKRVRVNRK